MRRSISHASNFRFSMAPSPPMSNQTRNVEISWDIYPLEGGSALLSHALRLRYEFFVPEDEKSACGTQND